MENNFEARRHAVRIGVLFTAAAVLATAFWLAVADAGSRPPLIVPLATLGIAALGLGLVFRVPGARVVTGVLLAGGIVIAIGALLSDGPMGDGSIFDVGNALASTVLIVWLCICGLLGLFAPERRTTWITVRLAGACFALIAAAHLWFLYQVGFALGSFGGGSFATRFSAEGTVLWGFPGWPIWHLALLALSLVMLAGPRRTLVGACNGLLALFIILAPLTLYASTTELGMLGLAPVLVMWAFSLLPLYLVWWLREQAIVS